MNKQIKLGEQLGKYVAPIVLSLIYFLILSIGLFMRLIGKDLLNLKFSKKNSYWINRQKDLGKIDKQF